MGPTAIDHIGDRRITFEAGVPNRQSGFATVWATGSRYPSETRGYVFLDARPRPPGNAIPGSPPMFLGQIGAVVGDVDGDSVEDVIVGYLDDTVHAETHARSIVFPGPFGEDLADGPLWRHGTDDDALTVIDAAWSYTRCDVNDDGLADICSARAIALAPAPFEQSILLPDATPEDRLDMLEVDGEPVLVRATAAGDLEVLRAADLPNLTLQQQLSTGGRAVALAHGDVTSAPGEELLAVIHDSDGGHLVVFTTEGDLTEVLRFTSPWPDGPHGDIVVGDLDGDAFPDVAFSTGGYVGVIAGPLDTASIDAVVWWHAPHDDSLPGFPFGYSLGAATTAPALLIGYPGRVVSREGDISAGGLYEIQHATVPP